MLYFTLGFITGAIIMFFLLKTFIFDFDASNCRKTCTKE